MTNEQINALIAEKVMGWDHAGGCNHAPCWWLDRSNYQRKVLPSFSTDPAASKQLRAKLAEKCDSTVLEWSNETKTFTFTMWPLGCAIKTWEGEGATEEAAVSACALKSVGVEVK